MSASLAAIKALRLQGHHEEARAGLAALAQQWPDDPFVQYEAASVHDFLGLERAAVPYYLAAIRSGLSGADLRGAYLGLGSTYRTLGMYSESKDALREGIKSFPDALELRVFLAMTLYNLGDFHEAVGSLLEIIAETSTHPQTRDYAPAIRQYAQDLDSILE